MSHLLDLGSLRKFPSEHANVTLRLASTESLRTKNDDEINDIINRHHKVQQMIEPIARLTRQGTEVRNWTGVHVPFLHTFIDTCHAMYKGQTLTASRGHGRIASVVDHMRSNGSGFAVSVPGILRFTEMDRMAEFKDLEMVHIESGMLNATFPNTDMIMKSGPMFTRMLNKLVTRQALIDRGARLSQEEKDNYLIKNNWTASRIIEMTVEFAARSFAFGLPTPIAEQLVTGDLEQMSVSRALESLRPRLLAPA